MQLAQKETNSRSKLCMLKILSSIDVLLIKQTYEWLVFE